jgi:hypothetical protein
MAVKSQHCHHAFAHKARETRLDFTIANREQKTLRSARVSVFAVN